MSRPCRRPRLVVGRIVVGRIVVEALESMQLSVPEPRVELDAIREKYHQAKADAANSS